jgi:hypothetical protein
MLIRARDQEAIDPCVPECSAQGGEAFGGRHGRLLLGEMSLAGFVGGRKAGEDEAKMRSSTAIHA